MYDELQERCNVIFVEGVPSLDQYPPNQEPTLLVIDDCMDQLSNPNILKFFIRGSHHRNVSVYFLTQALFPKGMRQISLNCHYTIVFGTRRDIAQLRTFFMQIDPLDWRALMEAYKDATSVPHSYLLFDFTQNQLDHLRVRSHIFPGENTVVYIPKKKYLSGVPKEISVVDGHGSK